MKSLRCAAVSFASGHPMAYSAGLADHPDVDLVAVADVAGTTERAEMARRFASERHVPYFEDYRRMLDSCAPDIVSVCAPPQQSGGVLIELARRSVHMICEKPFAASLAEGERVAQAVRDAGVVFSLDIPSACFPRSIRDAQSRVLSGAVGRPRIAFCQFLQNKGPRYTYTVVDGEKVPPAYGELLNFGPYAFLAMAKAIGQPLQSVFARCDTFFYDHYREAGLEDMCLASITFSGGAVGHVVVGRTPTASLPATDYRLEIAGSEGSVFVEDGMGEKVHVWGPYTDGDDPFERGGLSYLYYSSSPVAAYINDVVEAVRSKGQPCITIEDALECMRFTEACVKADNTGQPVHLRSQTPSS